MLEKYEERSDTEDEFRRQVVASGDGVVVLERQYNLRVSDALTGRVWVMLDLYGTKNMPKADAFSQTSTSWTNHKAILKFVQHASVIVSLSHIRDVLLLSPLDGARARRVSRRPGVWRVRTKISSLCSLPGPPTANPSIGAHVATEKALVAGDALGVQVVGNPNSVTEASSGSTAPQTVRSLPLPP